MFRALSVVSGRMNTEGFMDHPEFVEKQTKTFTKQLPNAFLTDKYPTATQKANMSKETALFSLGSWNVETRQASSRDIDIDNYATSMELSEELKRKQEICQKMPLEQLASVTNYNEKIRCGWIYEKGSPGYSPKVSQGALGTVNGPVGVFANQNPKGTWYWNLNDAIKAVETDKCDSLLDCKSTGAPPFLGCGFSDPTKGGTGRGVPVLANGSLRFPGEMGAPQQGTVLLSGVQCPPPPPPGSAAAMAIQEQNACAMSPDGRLTNACQRQLLQNAGCKMDGTLYQTLASSWSPTDMLSGIDQNVAFQKYQFYATDSAKLPVGAMKDGSLGQTVALNSFKQLADSAKIVDSSALSFAARDLCLKKGTFDAFDFCTELTDMSVGPFRLECMQREFRKAGGQPSGTLYPTATNRTTVWGKYNTWGEFKAAVAELASATRSGGEEIQRNALTSFVGIQREAKPDQIGSIQGLELLWLRSNTFIGRRILSGSAAQFPSLSNEKPYVGQLKELQDGGNEFHLLTNLRPPTDMSVRLATQSRQGIIYNLNYVIDQYGTQGMIFDTNRAIGANIFQPFALKQIGTQCWKLRAGGPNYFSGFWDNSSGFNNVHQLTYSDCSSVAADKKIPAEWCSLTQEPDAPMVSWEGTDSFMGQSPFFQERRFPFALSIARSAQTRLVKPGLATLKYPAVLQLRTTMGSGFAATFRTIATNSWRTLTCTFLANTPGLQSETEKQCGFAGYPSADKQLRLYTATECNTLGGNWHANGECIKKMGGSYSWDCRGLNTSAGPVLFSIGPLKVFLMGTSLMVQWNSGSLSVNQVFPNVVQADGITPNYLAVVMRSDYAGRYPNTLSIVCGTKDFIKQNNFRLNQTSANTATVSTPDESALYASPTDGTPLVLGDQSGANTAYASIASLRLFDYSMEREDILKDVENNWKMAFPQV